MKAAIVSERRADAGLRQISANRRRRRRSRGRGHAPPPSAMSSRAGPRARTTARRAGSPSSWASMASAGSTTAAGSISSCRERPMAAWPSGRSCARRIASRCPTISTTSPPRRSPIPACRRGPPSPSARGCKPGETVLVNGATGTAGRLAVQIARHLGAKKIIATGRNAEALDAVAALGRRRHDPAQSRTRRSGGSLQGAIRGRRRRRARLSLGHQRRASADRRGQGRRRGGADPLRPDRRDQRRPTSPCRVRCCAHRRSS